MLLGTHANVPTVSWMHYVEIRLFGGVGRPKRRETMGNRKETNNVSTCLIGHTGLGAPWILSQVIFILTLPGCCNYFHFIDEKNPPAHCYQSGRAQITIKASKV